jgi:fructosamine-3-kinase
MKLERHHRGARELKEIPLDLLEALGIDRTDIVSTDTIGGGVSADIWRLELQHETVVVKRARSAFKVAADWQVNPDRVLSEINWHNFVRPFLPESVPKILAVAPAYHAFSMAMLDFPLWKAELLEGHVEQNFAMQVAQQLARIHSISSGRQEVREQFSYDDLFFAQRVDPYFLTTADRNTGIKDLLTELGNRLLLTKQALMHGDVSPKNILIGKAGPVFLDAETACYGDPAFDMAFCLTHLLLKSLLLPGQRPLLITVSKIMFTTYLASVDWEDNIHLAKRITRLLPAIMLARVDGKSPVEYLDSKQQEQVRKFCVPVIRSNVSDMDRLIHDWSKEIHRNSP